MHPRSPKLLEDIASAAAFVPDETARLDVATYAADRRRRLAVERSFEIIGEALLRLVRADPATVARISSDRQAIGLRSRLARGDDVDHAPILQIPQAFLPTLVVEVTTLLEEANAADTAPPSSGRRRSRPPGVPTGPSARYETDR